MTRSWRLSLFAASALSAESAKIRVAMARLIDADRFVAVDSLMNATRPGFKDGRAPLFFYGDEFVLFSFLRGKWKAWSDVAALRHVLEDLWLGSAPM